MKRIRAQIALVVDGTVLAALLLILIIYNIGASAQVQMRAEEAIYATADMAFSKATPSSLYYAEEIFVIPDDEFMKESEYSRKEEQIIAWCAEHEVLGIEKVSIGTGTYYLMERSFNQEDFPIWDIIYVDVTGEFDMIRRFNLYFVIAAIAAGILGMTGGYLLGRKLEQNEQAQRRFFENASHELKTPLAAIRGYADGIASGVITDYQKTGRVICTQTEKMRQQIEAILHLAKIDNGAMDLKKEDVDLAALVQDCLMPFEGMIAHKGIHIDLNLTDAQILADPAQLETAATNLLSNAIRYAKSRIRIEAGPDGIQIWNDSDDLAEEHLSRLFDRYYTGDRGDTGIGLALANEIVRMHGWTLQAEHANGGILFTIRFRRGV